MIYSDITFDAEAKSKLRVGVKKLAKAVGTTLGPKGRNAALGYVNPQGDTYKHTVVHDGVTVAKTINLPDKDENMGAQLLKQAAQQQVQQVGDGTTVVTLLTEAIFDEFFALDAAGIDPMTLRKPVEDEIKRLVTTIEALAIPIETLEQKKQIATISAEDPELGELVATVIDQMGQDGLVSVEPDKGAQTYVDNNEGMQIDKGYIHHFFMTNPDRLEATLENPRVFITDKSINTLQPLAKLLEECYNTQEKLVIITPYVSKDAMASMIDNKIKGAIANVIIQAPSFGVNQKGTLQDIAYFTGARYITEDAGHKFEDVTLQDLGKCAYVTSTVSTTLIVGGKGKKADIDARITELRNQIAENDSAFDTEKLKERLAKLTTGVAVIKVGGATEVEMEERLERVKDAVAATKAALAKGIVPGGETIYLQARKSINQDTQAGKLLYKALYKPFQKLLNNAALNDGEYYEKLQHADKNSGVDVNTGGIVDLIEMGVVDPTLVPISALKNAASIAIQIATTGVIINQYIEHVK